PVRKDHVLIKMRLKVPWKPESEAGHAGLVSMPLIIPPVKKKTYDLFGNLFGGLWKQAEHSIRDASHITIVGYSFPRTDHQSTALFLNAFMQRSDLPSVTILDPAPDRILDKFKLEFGIPQSRIEVRREYFARDLSMAELLHG
ncbi:unnamed protein product, partial [marine sediment metagenome]